MRVGNGSRIDQKDDVEQANPVVSTRRIVLIRSSPEKSAYQRTSQKKLRCSPCRQNRQRAIEERRYLPVGVSELRIRRRLKAR